MCQHISFCWIHRHFEFPVACLVDEFDDDILPHSFEETVHPLLKWVCLSEAATFRGGPLIESTGWVRFDGVRRTVLDVYSSPVRSPSGRPGRAVMVIYVSKTPVVFFLHL